MKKIAFLFFAAAGIFVSCSSDDDATNNSTPEESENVFFPLENSDYWVYNVDGSLQDGRDSLYVANDTVIGTQTYKKLKTKEAPTGFFNAALRNNGIRKDGDMLLVSGSASINVSEDFPFSISITDLPLLKENANPGDVIGTVTGTTTQAYSGINFRLDYTLTTTAKEDLNNLIVNGRTFAEVENVETKINLKISMADVPDFVLLAPQDVLVSQQYYAKNVGLIKTDSHFTYSINPTLANSFGIPATANETQQELLILYNE
ncbi:hypothetical protein GR160_17955 [Flavobacterium sp. Sd200]|uniref:hypothetical protein n=1 Tax=Flavobacterium sp. Sd200 TaxID=2692211 RepID=UPI00136D55FD|nr:hypothetical protein [Flavobacterium sp. Sd200]MXN93115.1 hypothetical protein [Flavobacterium sp. Sd200]